MPGPESFSYAVLRVVPSVERGERLNVGLVLFCRRLRFLGVRTGLDRRRRAAIDAECDAATVESILMAIEDVANGRGTSPLALLDPSDRFGWITAPSSTIVQPSPVHTGLTEDPAADLDRLFAKLVA